MSPLFRSYFAFLFVAFTGVGLVAAGESGLHGFRASANPPPHERVPYPELTADPLEPLNRFIAQLNHAFLIGIVRPSARVYRMVVPEPAREGLSNFSHNIVYPKRLANNLLQRKLKGGIEETKRFVVNSTLGIGGLMDPATKMGIGESNLGFDQTLQKWGWRPHMHLVVPGLGLTNERGLLGSVGDAGLSPPTYVRYLGPGLAYHETSETVEQTTLFVEQRSDPYADARELNAVTSHRSSHLLRPEPHENTAAVQTLRAVFLAPNDAQFQLQRNSRSVRVPLTSKRLKYDAWIQPSPSPVVYVVPGLGSHRLSPAVTALAEMLFRQGFSAVAVSSTFNHEFSGRGSTAALPGYLPVDTRDLHSILTAIDSDLRADYGGRLTSRALLGFSLGAFQTLCIAADATDPDGAFIDFQHFVAIDPPVDLMHGMAQLDEHYRAALRWQPDQRIDRISEVLERAVTLAYLRPSTSKLPFSDTEARYLVGLSFRLGLRDTIYDTQRRHNLGYLESSLNPYHRQNAYDEIMGIGYLDYFEHLVAPYYRKHGVDFKDPRVQRRAMSLKGHERALRGHHHVSVFANENDMLLRRSDISWLKRTFGSSRLTLYQEGGHLGNLYHSKVQAATIGRIKHLLEN